MMDESYRIVCPSNMYPADLDSTLSGGELGQPSKKPLPLNTARLKAFRQVTKGAILSILETGHVSIEFLKKKGDKHRLVELFVVTGDGQEISVEQWRTEGCSADSDSPALRTGDCDRTWRTFTYNVLPEKYWKKYAHACRFVDLVKSKTAKVTMYSDKAKGVLMENWPPNFEASFFQGPKIFMCGNEIRLKEESGASLLFHRDSINNLVNDYTVELIQHAAQMREQCLRLEASVMTVQTMSQNSEPLFPVTVGIRPYSSFCSSVSSNSGSIDLLSSPRFSHQHSSPSSGSQGLSASPPSSPSPQIDLRCLDSSIRHTPTSHPSPMESKASQSPYRHISTLEGRKLRRQLSDSTDSSYIHYSTYPSTVHSSTDLYHVSVKDQGQNQEIQKPDTFKSEESTNVQQQQQQQLFILPPVTSPSSQQIPTPLHSAQPNPRVCDTQGQMPHTCFPGAEPARQLVRDSFAASYGRQMIADGDMAASCMASDSMSSSTTPALRTTASAADKDLTEEETSAVVRQTFVAYTGWVSQHADGAIWIRYNEGTQLGVKSGQPEVVYVDQQGNRHRYLQPDSPHIPEVVRQKLEKLPMVIDSLKRRPSTAPYTLASA